MNSSATQEHRYTTPSGTELYLRGHRSIPELLGAGVIKGLMVRDWKPEPFSIFPTEQTTVPYNLDGVKDGIQQVRFVANLAEA